MDRINFIARMRHMAEQEVLLYSKKAADYSNFDNVFSHFESEGAKLYMSPQQILLVYMEKHLEAIKRYCLTGVQEAEGIADRIKDTRIYLALLEAMPAVSAEACRSTNTERCCNSTSASRSATTNIPCIGNIPVKAHKADAGFDLLCTSEVTIYPGIRELIHTGTYMSIPEGYECQIRPKSGLAVKHGITVLNTPGTIDAGYIGEVMVPIINHGGEPYTFNKGDKVAQAVVCKLPDVNFVQVNEFESTGRGANGFGSTGV